MPEGSRPRALADRLLALEALVCLALAAARLRTSRFEQVAAWASRQGRRPQAGGEPRALALRIARAVAVASQRAPWKTSCFTDALACQAMLRRRGARATIHYGARSRGSRDPVAHVWVSLDGLGLVGAAEAAGFAELEVWPPLQTIGAPGSER